jgi:vacuolar-type H+-ATPase subunit I/STV1
VFLAKGNVPAESYNFFIDILLNTIRWVTMFDVLLIDKWIEHTKPVYLFLGNLTQFGLSIFSHH